MQAVYFGEVRDGVLRITNRKQFDQEILCYEGKQVEILIRKKRRYRSNFQNRFYWGAVIPIMKQLINDAGHTFTGQQIHELLKLRFLKVDHHIKDGEFITEVRSTRDLTTVEFMEYMMMIQKFAAEIFSVYIPDPNEQLLIE